MTISSVVPASSLTSLPRVASALAIPTAPPMPAPIPAPALVPEARTPTSAPPPAPLFLYLPPSRPSLQLDCPGEQCLPHLSLRSSPPQVRSRGHPATLPYSRSGRSAW